MSTIPVLKQADSPAPRADLRSHRRYPLQLDADYKVLRSRRIERAGNVTTLNISSRGVLLSETSGSLPVNGLIEVAIGWPFLLEGVCRLKLVMRGRIVRSDERGTAVEVWSHNFHTTGPPAIGRQPDKEPGAYTWLEPPAGQSS
jgi:hypothetical protein